ncbi:MAG: hypothetical protein V4582_02915 [Pseudomonadota bacterium]
MSKFFLAGVKFFMWSIGAVVAIPVAVLMLLNVGRPTLEHIPIVTCTVTWLDPELKQVAAPFSGCPKHFDAVRTMGNAKIVEIDKRVYFMREKNVDDFGDNCMIGAACFPHLSWPHRWQTLELIVLRGPVNFSKLRAFLGGDYLSDGKAKYYQWHRIQDVDPPLDMARLVRVPGGTYVTDGHWVLDGEQLFPVGAAGFEPANAAVQGH